MYTSFLLSLTTGWNKQPPSFNSDMNFTAALRHNPNFPVLTLPGAGVWNLGVHVA